MTADRLALNVELYNRKHGKHADFVPTVKQIVSYIEQLRNNEGKSFIWDLSPKPTVKAQEKISTRARTLRDVLIERMRSEGKLEFIMKDSPAMRVLKSMNKRTEVLKYLKQYNRQDNKRRLAEALLDYFDEEAERAKPEDESLNHGRLHDLEILAEEYDWSSEEPKFSDLLNKIYENYSNAIGRTSTYRGRLREHIANGFGIVYRPRKESWQDESSALVG